MQLTLRQILGIDPPPARATLAPWGTGTPPTQTPPATPGTPDVAGPAAERQPSAA